MSCTDLSALAASHTPNTFGLPPQARKLATSETTIWRASGGWGNLPSSENTKLSLVSRSSWDTRDAANVKTALADITDLRNPGWSQAQTIDDESPQGDWPTYPLLMSRNGSLHISKTEKEAALTFYPISYLFTFMNSIFLYFWQHFYFIVFFFFIFFLLHGFT